MPVFLVADSSLLVVDCFFKIKKKMLIERHLVPLFSQTPGTPPPKDPPPPLGVSGHHRPPRPRDARGLIEASGSAMRKPKTCLIPAGFRGFWALGFWGFGVLGFCGLLGFGLLGFGVLGFGVLGFCGLLGFGLWGFWGFEIKDSSTGQLVQKMLGVLI